MAEVKMWAIQPGPVDKSELVERAARICYRSEMSETAEERMAFLGKLMDRGHTSVAEHARWVTAYEGDNPYAHYWNVRYGINITGPNMDGDWGGRFIVSCNARNSMDFYAFNILLDEGDVLRYDNLSLAERLVHASATFEISGISRACSHQLVRHRVNSPSQESQRFVASGDWQPVVPPSIVDHPDDEVRRIFYSSMNRSKQDYKDLREHGVPKQDARFVLPNACPTRLMVTGTFECWRGFLSQRLAKDAQWEIRDSVAQKIHAALMEVEPELFREVILCT